MTKVLTNLEIDVYAVLTLLDKEQKLTGTIRTKEKCPMCAKPFTPMGRLGLVCVTCKTAPKKYYIDLHFQNKRYRIFCDRYGLPLDSYTRALQILLNINEELKEHTFEPSKYVKSELAQYYTSSCIDSYIEEKKKTIAPSYFPTFKNHLFTAKEFFSNKDVREISSKDVYDYFQYLQKKDLKEKTIKNYLDTFKAFLNHLLAIEVIPTMPVFPALDIPPPVITTVSKELQLSILSATPPEDRPFILFLMLSGLRPCEARALKVSDIDPENRVILVRGSFSRNVLRAKRKGKRSPQVMIPIHPELLGVLKNCIKNKTSDAFVFLNPRTQKPYSQESVQRLWDNIRKKLNLPKSLRLYDVTRHSFATALIKENISLPVVSKLLGHTNTKTTERYIHVNIKELSAAICSVSFFGDGLVTQKKGNF